MTSLQFSRGVLAAGGVLLGLATLCGAFGAHALQSRLGAEQLRVYETAVRYHFYHALGLLAIGLAAQLFDGRLLRWSALLIGAGTVLFCGSLYALTFGAPRALGPVTPLGGLALIGGWACFTLAVLRGGRS